jgi:[protein-PII] uridylyltransferase
LEELEKLMSSDSDQYGDILSRLQNMEVLTLAALMHDVGKIDSHKDHAKTGAFSASKFARQLGMDEESSKRVEFLVRHHLRMNEVARLRDLSQIKTIKDFASVIKDQSLLDMLLLLSIADINGVGSRNWNPVQMRFLMELHERASVVIRSPDRPPADIDKHRNRVRRELRLANLPLEEVDEHCDSMPAGYLLNTSPEELALHIGYVMSAKADYPGIDVREDRGVEYTQVTVFTPDKPGLLCEIAGTLAALGVGIHAAQVYTRESPDHIAIDKLLIDFEGRQLTQMKKWQVESELAGVLKGEQTVDEVWARLGKNRKRDITGVSVSWTDNVSDHHTVLEIRADDAPGLLHHLTGKIAEHGMNIHSARVATWGHQARDVFYVTDADGKLMTSESLQQFADKF